MGNVWDTKIGQELTGHFQQDALSSYPNIIALLKSIPYEQHTGTLPADEIGDKLSKAMSATPVNIKDDFAKPLNQALADEKLRACIVDLVKTNPDRIKAAIDKIANEKDGQKMHDMLAADLMTTPTAAMNRAANPPPPKPAASAPPQPAAANTGLSPIQAAALSGAPQFKDLVVQLLKLPADNDSRTKMKNSLTEAVDRDSLTAGGHFRTDMEKELAQHSGLKERLVAAAKDHPDRLEKELPGILRDPSRMSDAVARIEKGQPAPAAPAAPTGPDPAATLLALGKLADFKTFANKAGLDPEMNAFLGLDKIMATGTDDATIQAKKDQLAKINPLFEQMKLAGDKDPQLFTKLAADMDKDPAAVLAAAKAVSADPSKAAETLDNLQKTIDKTPAVAQKTPGQEAMDIIAELQKNGKETGFTDFIGKVKANQSLNDALGLDAVLDDKTDAKVREAKLAALLPSLKQIRDDAKDDPEYFKKLSETLDNAPKQSISELADTIKEHPEKLGDELKKIRHQADNPLAGFSQIFSFLDKISPGLSDRIMSVLGKIFEAIVGSFESLLGGAGGKPSVMSNNGGGLMAGLQRTFGGTNGPVGPTGERPANMPAPSPLTRSM